jgi:hypothetical protein
MLPPYSFPTKLKYNKIIPDCLLKGVGRLEHAIWSQKIRIKPTWFISIV